MNKIDKFLRLLSHRERNMVFKIIADIQALRIDSYDVKPLKGHKGVFRLRKGDIRCVFIKDGGHGLLLDIDFRKNIYKNL